MGQTEGKISIVVYFDHVITPLPLLYIISYFLIFIKELILKLVLLSFIKVVNKVFIYI